MQQIAAAAAAAASNTRMCANQRHIEERRRQKQDDEEYILHFTCSARNGMRRNGTYRRRFEANAFRSDRSRLVVLALSKDCAQPGKHARGGFVMCARA